MTYKDKELRKAVALEQSKSSTEEDAIKDEKRAAVYYRFMNDVPMAGYVGNDGKYVKGIEDYVSKSQYNCDEHRRAVVSDIKDGWTTLSRNGKFHALLATSSIKEAIAYYRLFREMMPDLKVSALFDPSDNHNETSIDKIDGLVDIISDYNDLYDMKFSISTYKLMRKDISARLAHKEPYLGIQNDPEAQLNLLIVVDQMLTGFDSKWLNTLYMDKVLEYEHLIQAFSRTNRLFGPDKPFGTIRYYRYPHSMERNINAAVKLYSGEKPKGLFVERLEYNLNKINAIYRDIEDLFKQAGVDDFSRLPEEHSERAQFAKRFNELNKYLEAAKIQGFRWEKEKYEFKHDNAKFIVVLLFGETIYNTLLQRYKELASGTGGGTGSGGDDEPAYDIETYITEIDTGRIDADYMNSRFDKWIKSLNQPNVTDEQKRETLDELHRSFATLSQEAQNFAYVFLHDVESGDVELEPGKTLMDYITEYQTKAQNDRIHRFAGIFGLNEKKLREIILSGPTESSINRYGRLDELKNSADIQKCTDFFERESNQSLLPPIVIAKFHALLKEFILGKDKRSYDFYEITSTQSQAATPSIDIDEEDIKPDPLSSKIKEQAKSSVSGEPTKVDDDTIVLIGCIKDVNHFNWIFRKKTYEDEKKNLYNVRKGGRQGAVKRSPEVWRAKYAVLYHLKHPNQYLIFKLEKQHFTWDRAKMKASGYIDPKKMYYIYMLAEQINCPNLDIASTLEEQQVLRGTPVYLEWKDIKKK